MTSVKTVSAFPEQLYFAATMTCVLTILVIRKQETVIMSLFSAMTLIHAQPTFVTPQMGTVCMRIKIAMTVTYAPWTIAIH
jgi:hypothetical protein